MSLPSGVTYKAVALWFQGGWTIYGLANKWRCSPLDIEHAIRMVMRRNQGGVS